jgi:ABC-2 type transport system permease protein
VAERIYPALVKARVRSQVAYRLSFAMDVVAQVIAQCIELVVILVLSGRVDALGGFSVDEVLLMYAMAGIGFGLADLTAGQLDELPAYIRAGTFDAILLRPLGSLPQMLVSDFRLRRAGRVLTGLVVYGYALGSADVHWTPLTVLLVIIGPLAGAVIMGSVWVVASTVTFWLVDSRELTSSVTFGSSAFTSYPITVFSGWLRRFFAFVVPGAFVAYYPSLALLGKPDPLGAPGWVSWISPLVALASAAVAGLMWRFAVRHYRGTGS